MFKNNDSKCSADHRPISLKEHQSILLKILGDFAKFCDDNNLTYFLDAGTLLGAVRHKGFIPWDDDIDVCMMRADYNRFIELVKKNDYYLNDYLIVEMPETTIYPFLKIGDIRTKLIEFPDTNPIDCYAYIDLFPKDGIQSLSLYSKWVCKKSEILRLFHWFTKYSIPYWKAKGTIWKRLIATITAPFCLNSNFPFRYQQNMIINYSTRHSIEQCNYVTTLVKGEYNKCAPRSCFDEYCMLQFEGMIFKAPIGYDRYLHSLYEGDYMELPPEDKRKHHNIIISWREPHLGMGENGK